MHPASIDLGAAWSTTVAMRPLQKTEKGKYIAPTYPCQQQSVRIGGCKRNFKKNLDLIEMLLVIWKGFVGDEGCDERLFASKGRNLQFPLGFVRM